jgi:hypothetical protein
VPYLAGYPTPQDYGATGNGVTDDTAAVQAAITAVASGGSNAVGVLVFPAGTYLISSALTLGSFIELRGMGSGISVISQSATTANGVAGTDLTNVGLTGLSINGPGSGSGLGVNFGLSLNNDTTYVDLTDLQVHGFGSHGIEIQSPVVCKFHRVISSTNGADGWHIYGSGTSCAWSACYALNNAAGIGYHLISLSYSSLSGCAADSNADGYDLSGCYDVALIGCGTESDSAAGYILSGGAGNSLTSCFNYANNLYSIHVTGGEANATISGFTEHGPTGSAVNSILVDSGTTAVIVNPNVVTATSYAAGTSVLVSPAATAVNASAAAGSLSVTNGTAVTGTGTADVSITESLSTSRAFGTKVAGDTEMRYYINAKGDANYGAGTSTDFQLLRLATGVLGASKSFQVGSGTDIGSNGVGVLKAANASTVPTTNPAAGAAAYARNGAWWTRDPNGVVSPMISPSEFSTSPTGCLAETFPRCMGSTATATQTIGATTGTVYMMGVWLPAGLTITNMSWITGTTAAVSPTHWWLGIANSAGLQQAATADQTTAAIGASALKTIALTATYTTTSTGLYYLLLSVTASTNPTATGLAVPITQMNLATPVLAGVSATTQSAPGTNGTTSYTAPASAGGIPYMYLT